MNWYLFKHKVSNFWTRLSGRVVCWLKGHDIAPKVDPQGRTKAQVVFNGVHTSALYRCHRCWSKIEKPE